MKKILSLIAGVMFMTTAAVCNAQTTPLSSNPWYHAGEYDIQVSPMVWVPPVGKPTYGVAVSACMWETAYMGTELEVGNNDAAHTYPGLNFVTTKQVFRVTFGRLAVLSETGATRWLYDGSTSALVGAGANVALYKFRSGSEIGLSSTVDENFGTTLRDSGLAGKAAFTWSF